MLVLATPGLAPLVQRDLAALDGVEVGDTGSDGRADVVLCTVPSGTEARLLELRSADDVLVEIGRTLRSEGDRAPWIARRLWRASRVERALGVWADTRPAKARRGPVTFRVITRVRHERSFRRTELRDHLNRTVAEHRRSWRIADPARLEIWALEYASGRFVAGMRLSDASMRQHSGRVAERPGALRPGIAAAMVSRAGEPPGTLLDPCCGSGTILSEAAAAGWQAYGRDIDADAVTASRRNARGAEVAQGDVRELDLPDATVRACVSNLPFGRQYGVEGDPEAWAAAALAELARVTVPGGRVVLLIPKLPRSAIPTTLRQRERHPLRVLGVRTTLWVFDRR